MTATPKTVRDPVCGMEIDPGAAAGQSNYNGRTYFFCADVCKQKFDARPALYVSDAAPDSASKV